MTEATEADGAVDDVARTPLERVALHIEAARKAPAKDRERELETALSFVTDLLEEEGAGVPDVGEVNGPEGALVAALARAQAAFRPIAKTKTATVRIAESKGGGTYSYTYADLADVLAAVRPALAREGLAVTQQTRHRQPDGKVELVTTLRHVGGAAIVSEVLLGQEPGNPQQFGGALTYLRRYELTTLVGVAAEEDRDAQHVEPVGRGNGAPAAPRMPAWAAPAPLELKREAAEVLERLIPDKGTARQYGAALGEACDGAFPATVARWLVSLPAWQEEGAKAAKSREEAAAQTARREQDAAAEQPDTPPAEPYAEDGVSPRADDPRYEEPPAEEPPADEPAGDPELPPAGTVDNPFEGATELDEEAIGQLRELGCVCPDPTVDVGRVDECPIRGHGIPF